MAVTKACPHESVDGYPEILDSRFHGNDMNFFFNLLVLIQPTFNRLKSTIYCTNDLLV